MSQPIFPKHVAIGKPEQFEDRSTIVHCRLSLPYDSIIRIWPEASLIQENGIRKKLIHAFKIAVKPSWSEAKALNGYSSFTLLFEGLDKDCSIFHLLEDIPEPGGFYSHEINRSSTDVYNIEIFTQN
jgi:hypothetical protein